MRQHRPHHALFEGFCHLRVLGRLLHGQSAVLTRQIGGVVHLDFVRDHRQEVVAVGPVRWPHLNTILFELRVPLGVELRDRDRIIRDVALGGVVLESPQLSNSAKGETRGPNPPSADDHTHRCDPLSIPVDVEDADLMGQKAPLHEDARLLENLIQTIPDRNVLGIVVRLSVLDLEIQNLLILRGRQL